MDTLSTKSKTLLDLMKSKYTPFLPATTARQGTLSFKTSGGDSASDDDDSDDDGRGDEDSTQGSQ